jgi:hypothetical protein
VVRALKAGVYTAEVVVDGPFTVPESSYFPQLQGGLFRNDGNVEYLTRHETLELSGGRVLVRSRVRVLADGVGDYALAMVNRPEVTLRGLRMVREDDGIQVLLDPELTGVGGAWKGQADFSGAVGRVAVTPDRTNHVAGAVVSLRATAAPGFVFSGWVVNGQSVSVANPLSLTMTSAQAVQAEFQTTLPIHPLTVEVVNGSVGSGAGGVVFRMPADGSYGRMWQEGVALKAGVYKAEVVVDGPFTVPESSYFPQLQGGLFRNDGNVEYLTRHETLELSGGRVLVRSRVRVLADGVGDYALAMVNRPEVTLRGLRMVREDDGIQVLLDPELTGVGGAWKGQADFSGAVGRVAVTPDRTNHVAGAVVSLRATAAPGFVFSGWVVNGQPVSVANPLSLTMTSAQAVQAEFRAVRSLLAGVQGAGRVDRSVALDRYTDGSAVTLTAVPEKGWEFVGWTGSATGAQSQISLTLNQDHSVIAKFRPVFASVAPQTVEERQPWQLKLLAGDPSVVGHPLTYRLMSGPAGPTLDDATGTLNWTPGEADGGKAYDFQVAATDTTDPSVENQLSFRLTVAKVNHPPMLAGVSNVVIVELAAWSLPLAGQDLDLPVQTLSYSLVSGPSGMSVDPTNGVVRWTPTEAQGPSTNLVTVTVSDGSLTTTNSLTVTVREVNVAPVLVGATNAIISELQAYTQNLAPQDTDLPNQLLTVALISGPTGLVVTTNGVLAWTPTEAQGPSTNVVITLVSDGQFVSTNRTTLVVREVNIAPRFINSGGTNLALLAWWNFDSEEPEGASIKSIVGGHVARLQGRAKLSVDGMGRPGGGRGLDVSLNNLGYAVFDASGEANPLNEAAVDDQVTITFWQRNFSIVNGSSFWAVGDDGSRVSQGHVPWSDEVIYWDTSGCCASSQRMAHQVAGHELLSWHLYSFVKRGTIKEIWMDDRLLASQAGAFRHGIYSNRLIIGAGESGLAGSIDGIIDDFAIWKGALDVETIRKLALGAKPSDLIGPSVPGPEPSQKFIDELALFTERIEVRDTDVPVQSLTVALISGPPGLVVTNGVVRWTPTEAQGPSTNLVTVTVSDGSLTTTNSLTVTVREVNVDPVLVGATNAIINETVGHVQVLVPLDSDVPAQSLTVSLVSGPAGLVVTNGVLAWTPPAGLAGSTNSVQVAVSDGIASVTNSFTLFVREVIDPQPNEQVTLAVKNLAVAAGADVRVPVSVERFERIDTLQFTLAWDPQVVAFKALGGFGLPAMTEANFGMLKDSQGRTNRITFSWDDSSFVGVTRTNGASIFEVVFQAVGASGATSAIAFVAEPAGAAATVNTVAVPLTTLNGSVTVQSRMSGAVEYFSSTGGRVPGVTVTMGGAGSGAITTGADGGYSMEMPGGAFTVTPTLETDTPTANGVSTADIAILRRHILGITTLDSAHKVLAGDVNGSSSVTTADITLIRRLILGVSTNFTGGLWRFVPSDEVFTNAMSPWTARRGRSYATMPTVATGHDFKAIKLGDVNGSWKAPTVATGSVIKNKAKGRITIGKVRAVAGETVMIPVSLSGLDRLGSMQMTLSWDAKAASFEGVEGLGLGELNPENLGLTRVNEGLLSVSWDHPSGRVVDSKGTAGLFQLKLRTKTTTVERGEIRVTEGPTRLELTDGDVEVAASVDPGWFEIGGTGEVASDSVSLRFLGLNPDGRIELEARGPEGMKLNLEASDTLKAWAEVQSVTGQGSGNPVKVTLKPDPQFQSKFWRARVQ